MVNIIAYGSLTVDIMIHLMVNLMVYGWFNA